MGKSSNWTSEEKELLRDMWGDKSFPVMAKRLGRSINAIKIMAGRLNLPRMLDCGNYVTFSALLEAIGQHHNYSFCVSRWTDRGLPIKKQRVNTTSFRTVDIDDFWLWAEKNKDAVDFSRFEPGNLGKEPDWVAEKRRADQLKILQFKKTPWTKMEDEELVRLLNQFKYSYIDISAKLQRTEGAIKRRVKDLNLKQRPVKQANRPWEAEEVEILLKLKTKGYGFAYIGQQLNRSAQACRGRYERWQNPDYMKRYWRRLREKERGTQ